MLVRAIPIVIIFLVSTRHRGVEEGHSLTRQGRPAKVGPAALILLSGGIDSTACVDFYQRQRLDVNALFIDYGQPAQLNELHAARRVAKHFEVPLRIIRCTGVTQKAAGLIVGRNALLTLWGMTEFHRQAGLVVLGIHSGTPYYDCSPPFISSMQSVADGYSAGRLRVAAPFLLWTKRQIWDYCIENRVPTRLTYSCEAGARPACGTCESCRDREVLHARKK